MEVKKRGSSCAHRNRLQEYRQHTEHRWHAKVAACRHVYLFLHEVWASCNQVQRIIVHPKGAAHSPGKCFVTGSALSNRGIRNRGFRIFLCPSFSHCSGTTCPWQVRVDDRCPFRVTHNRGWKLLAAIRSPLAQRWFPAHCRESVHNEVPRVVAALLAVFPSLGSSWWEWADTSWQPCPLSGGS